jgi:hypothetical protein
MRLRDDDGEWTGDGDTVGFCYGIPPVSVHATISARDGKLMGSCPGHNPAEFNLRSLRRYVGRWYKGNTSQSGSSASRGVGKEGK